MKKRSFTNLRFEFQPDIMVESPRKDEIPIKNPPVPQKSPERKGSPENAYLNINTGNFKKLNTLSYRHNKQAKKSPDKSSIKKSSTRTSKWSQLFKNSQKGGKKSPGRTKTIERKFTMSSSISSIRCNSKNRGSQKVSINVKKNIGRKSSLNPSAFKRFKALNLNITNKGKSSSAKFTSLKFSERKASKPRNKKIELDPSLERSLERISKNDILASSISKHNDPTIGKILSRRTEMDSGVSHEDLQLIGDLKDSIHEHASPRNGSTLSIDKKTLKLADSIIKKKTLENNIYPNQSIIKTYGSQKTAKYGISMYNPSINYETLKKFFSVKLVKSNKEILNRVGAGEKGKTVSRWKEEFQLIKTPKKFLDKRSGRSGSTRKSINTSAGTLQNNRMYMSSTQNKNMFKIKPQCINQRSESTNFPPIHGSQTSIKWNPSKDNGLRISLDSTPYLVSPNPARNEQSGSIGAFPMRSSGFDSIRKELKKLPKENGSKYDHPMDPSKQNGHRTVKINKK